MSKIIAFFKNRDDTNRDIKRARQRRDSAIEGSNRRPMAGFEEADQILVSVVVPTCGRPALLNRCLAGLVLQSFDTSRFEIIVVDDAPNQKTREVVYDWTTHTARDGPVITYNASDGPHGPAAARNRGWRAARGSIIAFTDDDTVARTDWLERGMRAFGDGVQPSSVQAVWGRIVMPLHRTPTDYEYDAKRLEQAEFVTANCFCRKAVLESVGGFDERFRFAWREDADMYFRLLEMEVRIAHVPSAVIVHPIRPASWGVSLTQQRKVLFDALLFKKHPALYRKKIRSAPRWDYYVIVLALMACIVGAVLHAQAVAIASASIWIALTARFCLNRLRHTVKTPAHIGEMIVTSALIPPLAVFWRMVGALKFRTRFI